MRREEHWQRGMAYLKRREIGGERKKW